MFAIKEEKGKTPKEVIEGREPAKASPPPKYSSLVVSELKFHEQNLLIIQEKLSDALERLFDCKVEPIPACKYDGEEKGSGILDEIMIRLSHNEKVVKHLTSMVNDLNQI